MALGLAIITGFMIGRSDAGELWMVVALLAVIAAAVAGYQTGKSSGGNR